MSIVERLANSRDVPDDEGLTARVVAQLSARYEIDGEAGRGGMAFVFDARRRSDGARIAIKVLRRGVAEALGAQRFLREIQIATDILAPTLMPQLEWGEIDGSLYYAMPFAAAGSLRTRIATERQLPMDDAVRIARDVANGAAALHERGFIHRDIKPENILHGVAGETWLADFGIARALYAAATDLHTSTGIVLGTPAYMSPEQAGGEEFDGRSDVYAIGCVLYEMLAGTPPFQGASTMAVIARHMTEPPPSLRIVRPTVGDALEAVVLRALAKTPADRYATAAVFSAALDELRTTDMSATLPKRSRRLSMIRAAFGIAAAAVLALGVYRYATRPATLDPDRVVVFPLAGRDPGQNAEGERLAMLVGNALERTDATAWLDGATLMKTTERDDPRHMTDTRFRALAADARARYYLGGTLSRLRESVTVQLRLSDTRDGSVLARASESSLGAQATADAAMIRALIRVMPALLGLGRVVDIADLSNRNPAAIDNWLRGEREFRNRRMDNALRFLAQAVTTDSLLAPAAFRAAIAASWTSKGDTAMSLVRLALRHPESLSARQRQFATALERYLAGRADEALVALRPALGTETGTADAWMLAGEIQLHLLPTVGVDSESRRAIPQPTDWPYELFAEQAFQKSRGLDSGFVPPLAHLAEIGARRGDQLMLARNAALVSATGPDSVFVARMRISDRCLRNGASSIDWRAEARKSPRVIFAVGAVFKSATLPKVRQCATAAFASLLATESTDGDEFWSALVALHGMLIAQGEETRALHLVDTAVADGLSNALGLFVLDASAGVDVGERASPFLQELASTIAARGPPSLWLLTLDAARRADVARLTIVHRLLQVRARKATAQRLDTLMTDISAAWLAVAQHDSAKAIALFDALVPTAEAHDLDLSLWESLAPERLQYARLLLGRGRFVDAHRVASTFDQPSVFVHQLFLRASLDVRVAAATALHDERLKQRALDKLAALRRAASS